MDRNRINDVLSKGLAEIDDELKLHEEIREVAKDLALRIMWEGGATEYITDEYGVQHPYSFIYEQTVSPKNGAPVARVYVINIHNMEAASQIQGKQYKPAKYEAIMDGEYSREEIVQTILSTAIASIKGIILLDEEEGE